ncbi:MAG: hypothetical protein P4K86_02035 [Terracidiphilus sp.]|nr:hypothetical protein [Terracidiphilus sp.]
MQEFREHRAHPELKKLVAEASRALACLDADRLEELALSCQALNRDWTPGDARQRAELARQAKDASGDIAVLARVIEATNGNFQVMKRLRGLRADRLEYSEVQARGWTQTGSGHGDN